MPPARTWRSSNGLIMPCSSAICLIHRSLLITCRPWGHRILLAPKESSLGACLPVNRRLTPSVPTGTQGVDGQRDRASLEPDRLERALHGVRHRIALAQHASQERGTGPGEHTTEGARVQRGAPHRLHPRKEHLALWLMQPVVHGDTQKIRAPLSQGGQK